MFTYFAFRMNDIQAHLPIDRQERLFTDDFLAIIGSNQTASGLLWRLATYSGNSPLQRATYSFLTVPAMNSEETDRARSTDNGRIINPDVSRSNLFTATSRGL